MAPFLTLFFLGEPLTFMIVYVWSRKNPSVRLGFLGLLNFEYVVVAVIAIVYE